MAIASALAVAVALPVSPGHCEDPDSRRYLVPAVARVPGEAGSLWRSDLVLHNPGGSPATVTLLFLERDRANPSPDARSLTLAPGVSVLSEDLLATLFGVSEGAGALLVVSDLPLTISSRTFNCTTDSDGLAATWGQYVPGVPVDAFAATTLNLLPQLTDNVSFRTNLGIVNLGYDQLEAWVAPKVFGGESPKARLYRVPANGMLQVNGLPLERRRRQHLDGGDRRRRRALRGRRRHPRRRRARGSPIRLAPGQRHPGRTPPHWHRPRLRGRHNSYRGGFVLRLRLDHRQPQQRPDFCSCALRVREFPADDH